MKSYVSTKLGWISRISESWNLYRNHSQGLRQNVLGQLAQARLTEARVSSLLGTPAVGLKMLELGPGQQLIQMTYFARNNDVVAVDRDVIRQYIDLGGLARMVTQNGWMRTFKTVARKMAGIDRRSRAEVMSQLGLKFIPKLRVFEMDAAQLDFSTESFDAVYSRAFLEHVLDPKAVVSEMARVLRPGGAMFSAIHLFTSDSGCHDTRTFSDERGALPFWAHLRPECEAAVRANSYLNKMRLSEWVSVFQSLMPGSTVEPMCDSNELLNRELRHLRAQGQLKQYSDAELLSVTVTVSWRKPIVPSTG